MSGIVNAGSRPPRPGGPDKPGASPERAAARIDRPAASPGSPEPSAGAAPDVPTAPPPASRLETPAAARSLLAGILAALAAPGAPAAETLFARAAPDRVGSLVG